MDDAMMETIRANARYYRLANGLSGSYIGDAIGHDASWVQQFEAGAIQKPKPADLIKLAHVLGFRLSDLIKTKPALLLYISPEENRTGLEKLEEIRHRRGVSKRQFSLSLGLSEGHYTQVLNGYRNFSIKIWWKIADALDMDLNVLIGRRDNGL
ncbi:helix-turn-helix domain-containing protein [Acidaminococcus provencensis]|uniref:helix-turn-helix domain-containing protein n=1 Tax=Acidaminococcus provencensis TaxID=2058289 RepID=UPI0022E7287C|nr:helix-turn-helix transcriptional regulator [Acidaminococcus provencensis]